MAKRRVLSIFGACALAAGMVALAPTPVSGQAEPCEQPYSPVAFAATYPDQDVLPDVPGDVVSRPLDLYDTAFDSDGDGVDDTVTPGAGSVVITRGDGVVTLTSDGAVVAFGVGDLDGDGRDEFGASANGALGGTFLLPGTTPPGTTVLQDTGIRMPIGTFGLKAVGDGSDRLLGYVEPTNSVVSGRTDMFTASEVLALGPGGDASALTPPTTPGRITTVADLGGPELALISGRIAEFGPAAIQLFIWDGDEAPGVEPTSLTTDPETYFPEYVEPFGPVEVIVGSEGTFVTLTQSSRGGGAAYLWSLDDPCTPYVVGETTTTTTSTPASTPTAPAARPVATEARFTG